MEDGLVLLKQDVNEVVTEGLNPCCSGRWSRTIGAFYGCKGW